GSANFQRGELEHAASEHGFRLVFGDVRLTDDLDHAIRAIASKKVDALLIFNDGLFFTQRDRIVALASETRLPDFYVSREFVVSDGLISYGTDLNASFRRTAIFVDKILKGASHGDLPIEFPTKLEMIINAKRAKALGLVIPPLLLARADQVIE